MRLYWLIVAKRKFVTKKRTDFTASGKKRIVCKYFGHDLCSTVLTAKLEVIS